MGRGSSAWMRSLWALVRKDLVEEFRTRYAFNSLLMFAVTTLVMVSFAVGIYALDPGLHAAFIWIIIFFSAMSGVGRSFVKEEEKGTAHALRLSAPPEIIYLGKLLFNLLLVGVLTVLILPLYYILMAPPPTNTGLLITVAFLGVFCLASATTILSAIVSRAGGSNTLLPILSFPVLLPVLVTAISATQRALQQVPWAEALSELQFLFSYGVVVTIASLLLFAYVWND